jgi:hypothetical protein
MEKSDQEQTTYIIFEKKYITEKAPQITIISQKDFLEALATAQRAQEAQENGEEWKAATGTEQNIFNAPKPKKRLVYEFVAQVFSPSEVAAIVRKAPLKKYALFSGKLQSIEIQMPVVIDGVPADAMSSEWAVSPEWLTPLSGADIAE